jgi:hypothetical protein
MSAIPSITSLPFEIETAEKNAKAKAYVKGHISVDETGLRMIYHSYTIFHEQEVHDLKEFLWTDLRSVTLKMSLFSASVELYFQKAESISEIFGAVENRLKLKIHRRYRNDAKSVVALIEKEISRAWS